MLQPKLEGCLENVSSNLTAVSLAFLIFKEKENES